MRLPIVVFDCNYMPVFYRFPIDRPITIYWLKICVFSHFTNSVVSFEALVRGLPWNLGYGSWHQKKLDCTIPEGENSMVISVLSQ